MKGATVKKAILRVFSRRDLICHHQKFQPWQTPPSRFLPRSPRFLTNIRCRYFSLNIWVVYDQLELDWCIFDQNWAKTRPLHFQIFQILNAIDRPIVHCINSSSGIPWKFPTQFTLLQDFRPHWKVLQALHLAPPVQNPPPLEALQVEELKNLGQRIPRASTCVRLFLFRPLIHLERTCWRRPWHKIWIQTWF